MLSQQTVQITRIQIARTKSIVIKNCAEECKVRFNTADVVFAQSSQHSCNGVLACIVPYDQFGQHRVLGFTVWAMAQTPADPLIEGLRNVEVASVADAIEQLYGQKAYMSHDMRPIAKTKFAGPAYTVLLKKEEHKEGSKASQGMLDAIDAAPPGSVYVMVLENGLDYAGMGALMSTAMKVRGLTAAVVDVSVRDTPQIGRIQFPVFSRGVVPSNTNNHYRFAGVNIPVTCAGVRVNAGDI